MDTDQLTEEIVALAWNWADGDNQQLAEAVRILTKTRYLEGTTMNDYLVTWAIDAESLDSPREAAQYARDAQVREGTWATVFDVKDIQTGQVTRVDLLTDEEYVITEGLDEDNHTLAHKLTEQMNATDPIPGID